jgi:type II secretory pathway pseudopilin PulG
MKVALSDKEIPTGSFYVRLDKFYIYDSKSVVLEYLTDLFKQRKANAYVLKFRDKYYVFLIEKDRLTIKEKDNINDILILYPNAIVKEDRYLKKIKPRTKGFSLNKKQLIAFPALLTILVILFVGYKKKQLAEKEARLRQMALQEQQLRQQQQQQQAVYKPMCLSNVASFLENYIPYSVIEEGILRVKVKDTTYNIPLESKETEPIRIEKLYMPTKDYNITPIPEGYDIRIKGYIQCLNFVFSNKDIPLTIRRITNEINQQQPQLQQNGNSNDYYNCEFILPFDCVSTTARTTATN